MLNTNIQSGSLVKINNDNVAFNGWIAKLEKFNTNKTKAKISVYHGGIDTPIVTMWEDITNLELNTDIEVINRVMAEKEC